MINWRNYLSKLENCWMQDKIIVIYLIAWKIAMVIILVFMTSIYCVECMNVHRINNNKYVHTKYYS